MICAVAWAGGAQHSIGTQSHSRETKAPAQDWLVYGGQKADDHYSPLTQINRGNVGKLKVAWTYRHRREGRWLADQPADCRANALRVHANAESHRARRCNRQAALELRLRRRLARSRCGVLPGGPTVLRMVPGVDSSPALQIFSTHSIHATANPSLASATTAASICARTCAETIASNPSR